MLLDQAVNVARTITAKEERDVCVEMVGTSALPTSAMWTVTALTPSSAGTRGAEGVGGAGIHCRLLTLSSLTLTEQANIIVNHI